MLIAGNGLKNRNGKDKQFVSYALGGITLKLLISIVYLAAYVLFFWNSDETKSSIDAPFPKIHQWSFFISFITFYLVYTFIAVNNMLKLNSTPGNLECNLSLSLLTYLNVLVL